MWWVRLILVLIFQPGTFGSSDQDYVCPPSSCGEISSISYPFRLKHDSDHCGDSRYELSCENNVTVLNLYSAKYHVKYINYSNSIIRLVDPGVQQSNCSSLPLYFLSLSNFSGNYENYSDPYRSKQNDGLLLFEHIVYLNCNHQVTNNPKYVNTTSCLNWHSNKAYYIYAMAGDLIVQDFQDGCHVKLVTPTSWPGLHRNHHMLSYDVMHKALAYGFEVSFWEFQEGPYCNNFLGYWGSLCGKILFNIYVFYYCH